MRGEDILLGMSINARGAILSLSHSIQVKEDGLDVLLVLEEEGTLDCLSNTVHLLQTHFLLLLIQPIFIQILNQITAQ